MENGSSRKKSDDEILTLENRRSELFEPSSNLEGQSCADERIDIPRAGPKSESEKLIKIVMPSTSLKGTSKNNDSTRDTTFPNEELLHQIQEVITPEATHTSMVALESTIIETTATSETQADEPAAPPSLTSAPPSYTYVMRQIHTQQPRPRFLGTFISSPSFVQRPPPPTYAATYDVYIDQSMAPITNGPSYNFGFHSMAVICNECGNLVMTSIRCQVTICTHLCALMLCLSFCWICIPLPYLLRSCKNVYHCCPMCGTYLGCYSPTRNASL